MVSKELRELLIRIQLKPRFDVGDEVLLRRRLHKVMSFHKAAVVQGSPWWYFLDGITVPVHEGMLRKTQV